MTYDQLTTITPESPAFLPINQVSELTGLSDSILRTFSEGTWTGIPFDPWEPPLIAVAVRTRDGARLVSVADARLMADAMLDSGLHPSQQHIDPLDPLDAAPF